jgi:8-oxo-dGTP diphosphatase
VNGVPGRDFVGVGVGALVFGADSLVFLGRRGPGARNEVGRWEFPGGTVRFGETLAAAVVREFREEFGMTVEVTAPLGVADHILPAEGQHWVSASFTAEHVGGEPVIRERDKCTQIGWFALDALPADLSEASRQTLRAYQDAEGHS